MDLWAATEASATSGWFEGWVGGLIAAAVTLAFTAWWETRQYRRRQLEEAAVTLSAACEEFSQALFEMTSSDRSVDRITRHFGEVAGAQIRVLALARRRLVFVPASVAGPCRAGFGRTIRSIDVELTTRFRALPAGSFAAMAPAEWLDTTEPLRGELALTAQACSEWIENPWMYWWNRDRIDKVRAIGKAAVESLTTPPSQSSPGANARPTPPA